MISQAAAAVGRMPLLGKQLHQNHLKLQVAFYRNPLMPNELHNAIEKRKEVILPQPKTDTPRGRRICKLRTGRTWARYGKLSDIAIKDLYPSKEEIELEEAAEKEWWPTFAELKKQSDAKIAARKQEKDLKEAKIAECMAKMPAMIAKYLATVEEEERKDKKRIEERAKNQAAAAERKLLEERRLQAEKRKAKGKKKK